MVDETYKNNDNKMGGYLKQCEGGEKGLFVSCSIVSWGARVSKIKNSVFFPVCSAFDDSFMLLPAVRDKYISEYYLFNRKVNAMNFVTYIY